MVRNSHPAEVSGSLSNGTESEFSSFTPLTSRHDCHFVQDITEIQEVQSKSFISDIILNCSPVFGEISSLVFYENSH